MSARVVREAVLTVGAIGGALCLVVALSSWALGTAVLVVQSGSMQPTIGTGALILTREVPASRLRVGDIVTVETASGQRVTHRIVRVTHRGAAATFALKGDANRVADPETYTQTDVDRLVFAIPALGRVVAVLGSPIGLVLLGGYLVFLFGVAKGELDRDSDGALPLPPSRRRRRGRRRATRRTARIAAGTVAVTAIGLAAAGTGPQPTYAAWTDSVPVGTSTMSTSTVPAPTLQCGTLGALSVQFKWAAVSGATSYTLYYNNGANSTTVTGLLTAITGAVNLSSEAWVVANRDFGSTTWTSQPSNHRSYTFLVVLSICG
ncbi:MAG TPA: signal peptidase I [Aeromicrobium sp.]|nr:signal peptidase I [Aeromicrobium sp.]